MSITIELNQEEQKLLAEIANRRGLTPEEYARNELQSAMAREEQFLDITEYVLNKNEELYRRLA